MSLAPLWTCPDSQPDSWRDGVEVQRCNKVQRVRWPAGEADEMVMQSGMVG